jgi:hypothetical protein
MSVLSAEATRVPVGRVLPGRAAAHRTAIRRYPNDHTVSACCTVEIEGGRSPGETRQGRRWIPMRCLPVLTNQLRHSVSLPFGGAPAWGASTPLHTLHHGTLPQHPPNARSSIRLGGEDPPRAMPARLGKKIVRAREVPQREHVVRLRRQRPEPLGEVSVRAELPPRGPPRR